MLLLGACAYNDRPYTGPIAPANTSTVFWVDADPACETGFAHMFEDPDDCPALELAIHAGARIDGLSTTKGNTDATTAYDIGKHVAQGRFPVYKGSNDCTDPMVAAFKKAATKNRVTILALGPLTNIATILRCEPTLKGRITEIIFVGGRQPLERFVPNPNWWLRLELKDLNVEVDQSAVVAVLEAGVPLKLVPYKAGRAVILDAWELAFSGTNLPTELLERLQGWHTLSALFLGTGGIMPFDPVAVAYALWPAQFTCKAVEANMAHGRLEVQPKPFSHIEHCLPTNPAQVRAHILKTL